MDFPFEWQPRVVSTQLAFIGTVAIACVPGEFTTMSGRRLRDAIGESVAALGGPRTSQVIVAGLCNTYSDYITTPEEYEVQVFLRFVIVKIGKLYLHTITSAYDKIAFPLSVLLLGISSRRGTQGEGILQQSTDSNIQIYES
jgi:hypothetical protein